MNQGHWALVLVAVWLMLIVSGGILNTSLYRQHAPDAIIYED